jgi:NADH:ubiquinone oxidoreductase subunit 5 (subunit L)/multisubunit Na+/H+ antiporter MnhA subunit
MPRTGAACFVGCVAIAGLPPLNGFAGELLLYAAAYRATAVLGGPPALPAFATIAGLALIGGLAAACFAKTFGIAFLGTARSDCVGRAHEPPAAMQGAVLALAAGCVLLGLLAPAAVRTLEPVLGQLTRLPPDVVGGALAQAVATLRAVVVASGSFLLLAAAIAGGRRWLLAGRTVAAAPTWGCGYPAPSARMQYGGSSFGQPLMEVFRAVVPIRAAEALPKGFFPATASFASTAPDLARERLWDPLVRGLVCLLARLRWLQHGRVQLYVLYVAATLVGLLFWKVGLR